MTILEFPVSALFQIDWLQVDLKEHMRASELLIDEKRMLPGLFGEKESWFPCFLIFLKITWVSSSLRISS